MVKKIPILVTTVSRQALDIILYVGKGKQGLGSMSLFAIINLHFPFLYKNSMSLFAIINLHFPFLYKNSMSLFAIINLHFPLLYKN